MRKRICFIMIAAVALLGGCAKSKDKDLSETDMTIREQEAAQSTESEITSVQTGKEDTATADIRYVLYLFKMNDNDENENPFKWRLYVTYRGCF